MLRRIGVLVLLAATAALAQDPADAGARYMALEREVRAAFAAGDYEKAAEACRGQIGIAPDQAGPRYNLACALARLGRREEALAALGDAVAAGYDDAGHMQADPDLESLRGEEAFAKLVAAAEAAAKAAAERLYEPGAEIPGVRTVEGDPEGGLRWRVRIGEGATAGKPHRLIVWLHPSGGSMNAVVEKLAPDFAEHGFALLVPSAKPWMSWSGEEARRLLTVTIPDAAEKVEGLDAGKPVLLGFSAGGQMALTLWAEDAGRFGGLVLDAAYPIDTAAYGRGEIRPIDLPAGEAARAVPFFVLVGDQDGGHRIWKQVEAPWREAGLPLAVTYVPGGRHAWLLGAKEKSALLEWLGKLRAE